MLLSRLVGLRRFFAFKPQLRLPDQISQNLQRIMPWFVLGFVIRILVMPTLVQSDFINNMSVPVLFNLQGRLIPTEYPGFMVYFFSGWFSFIKPLMPIAVYSDMNFATTFSAVPGQGLLSFLIRVSDPNIFSFLFVFKVPYLFLDFASAFLLMLLTDDLKKSAFLFKFWMVNPIAIFVSFVIGQFDIFVVFFMILTIYFLKTGRNNLSALSLGISAAFKFFPIIFVIPLALIFMKNI